MTLAMKSANKYSKVAFNAHQMTSRLLELVFAAGLAECLDGRALLDMEVRREAPARRRPVARCALGGVGQQKRLEGRGAAGKQVLLINVLLAVLLSAWIHGMDEVRVLPPSQCFFPLAEWHCVMNCSLQVGRMAAARLRSPKVSGLEAGLRSYGKAHVFPKYSLALCGPCLASLYLVAAISFPPR